jgi:hypothetical protein
MFSVSPTDIANGIPLFKALSTGWQIAIIVGAALAGGAAAGWFLRRAWDDRRLNILQTEVDVYRNRPSTPPVPDSAVIGQRLEAIEAKQTDPESKAELSELRQEVEKVRQPEITYENFDERVVPWPKTGEKPSYVHLWFRNEPTGRRAPDAAAKLSWWDIRHTALSPLFSVDGKWYEPGRVQTGNTTDLLPNGASHGLDLLVYKPGTDWSYGLSNSIPAFDERHRLHPSVYKVKVTISCEGYTEDFYFRVGTGMTVTVHEYVSANADDVRDEARR